MRYLILSDIHANLTALDTVLDTVKGRWDKVVCLGDVVGYGPDPNEVVDRIREIEATTIKPARALPTRTTSIPWRATSRIGPKITSAPKIASGSKNCPPARSPS